jgi:hypothetical protein
MKRPFRPKLSTLLLFAASLLPCAARAQSLLGSAYATRDGHAPTTILGCAAIDGSFTGQPCGVLGFPLHVQVDSTVSSGPATPTTAPGTVSTQAVGVQGAGSGAVPVAVSQSGVWTLTLPNGSHLALDAGGNVIGGVTQSGSWSVAVSNLPATQAISATALPLPAGAATAANQPAINGDGGSQVHVTNLPATQAVSGAVSVTTLPALAAGSNTIGTVVEANRSGAWTDVSFTATAAATTPAALAAVTSRTGLHVWNLGSVTACLNYTSVAAVSGSSCASGSVPIPAGSAYLEDQPGNVSPEAISLICTGTSCPLTVKVR